MGSDRARVTYDSKQQYRSVVMQQGRVTLEADWNEASQIASEELRRETLDIVGPCGTPDDGYEIVLPSAGVVTFNQIQFTITTSSPDFLFNVTATATLLGPGGATLQVIPLTPPTSAVLGNSSTQTVANLNSAQPASAIASIVISASIIPSIPSFWNIASVVVSLSNSGSGSTPIVNASGSPLARLSSNNSSFTLQTIASTGGTAEYDFSIQPGTMYVGGLRVHLLETVDYNNQPDWQDSGPEDPLWVSLGNLPGSPLTTDEFVYLYLREQEVSAVEDQDLKDVALGGPDTAQRTRILQRFVRVTCGGTDCTSGISAAEAQWAALGLTFDSNTMRLKSSSTLEVGFVNVAQNQTPCQPQASGGYVDPDNQLIRVQIAGIDPTSGNPQLIWGFDNASFLYRVDLDSGNSTLIFQSAPVDTSHQPAQNQFVELLRTAAILPNGQFVAAATGIIFELAQNYDPDQKTVAIPSDVTLPQDYTQYDQSPPIEAGQLFLRVWQDMIPAAQPGTAYPLGGTGVQVTLGSQSPSNQFHVGDYWMFAVRPATPQVVYPERYGNEPQPPDGPRLWACPLGVISWNDGAGTLISDCRQKFGPLAHRAIHVTAMNWPNDDLISIAAFRNNPLQVMFDYAPSSQSFSNSTMVVDVEVPYLPSAPRYNEEVAPDVDQTPASGGTKSAKAKTAAPLGKASPSNAPQPGKSSMEITSPPIALAGQASTKNFSMENIGISTGGIFRPVQRTIPFVSFDSHSILERYHFPPNLLQLLNGLSWVQQGVSVASQAINNPNLTGFMSLIQQGEITLASSSPLASWSRQLTASLDQYVSTAGGQLRVRVTIKGRDVWSATNPVAYLDGQVLGELGQRVDGATPCTSLTLPSGDNARASDFESWFWLCFAVWDRTDYPIGASAGLLATADFNGDGKPDLAVTTAQGTVVILLNNGDGTFQTGSSYATGSAPGSIVAADFRNNGINDLAIANSGDATVTILLGNGDGTFAPAPSSPVKVGNSPFCIVAADFNGDNTPDLAVTNSQDNTVSILLTTVTPSGNAPRDVAGGNATAVPSWTVSAPIQVGKYPTGLATGNLNNNGFNDLAVVNTTDSTVTLLFNDGKGNFTANSNGPITIGATPTTGTSGSIPFYITAADLDNDSVLELLIGCWDYQDGSDDAVGPSIAICINGDSNPGQADYYNDGAYPAGGLPGPIVVADFDGDGNLDLATTDVSFLFSVSNTFSVLPGNGDGTFQTPIIYSIGNGPNGIETTDFNGDGLPDLAITNYSDGTVSVLLNDQSQLEPLLKAK